MVYSSLKTIVVFKLCVQGIVHYSKETFSLVSFFFFRHKASNILPGARVLFIIVLDSVAQHRSSLNISITFYTNILR